MGTPRKPDTPEKAIRLKCLECCCGESSEVEQCGLTGCPLYDFRMYGVKKSEELAAKTPDEIIEPISKVDTGTGTICGEEPIHAITVEPVPCVKGTGVICGEPPVIAESVKPIKVKATKENIVMSAEEAEKHSVVVEQKPAKKKTASKKKQTNISMDDVKDDFDLDLDDEPVEITALDDEPVTEKKPVESEKKTTDEDIPDVDMEELDIDDVPLVETPPDSKPPIEDGHLFVVDLNKVERKEEAPVKKQAKKKEPKKKAETPVEAKPEQQKEEPADNLLDIDMDELFDI